MQESLARLDEVRLALEKATTLQEVKNVRDMAEAAEVYARQAKAGKDIQLQMAEYVVRAERKLGEMLQAAKDTGQIGRGKPFQKDNVGADDIKITLADAGISRDLSSRAQKLAAIPPETFETRLTEQKNVGKLSARKTLDSRKPLKPHYREPEIELLYDEGLNNAEIARRSGVGKRIVDDTVEHIRIRREAQAEPIISPEALPVTAQKKLELAIKQQLAKLDHEYQAKVQEAAWRYLELTIERWKKEQAQAKRLMESRNGIMNRAIYKKILVCLHPDWVPDPKQKRRYEEAFSEFTKLEKLLLNEKESPTEFMKFPKSRAEWEELRRKATDQRKAKRQKTDLKRAI